MCAVASGAWRRGWGEGFGREGLSRMAPGCCPRLFEMRGRNTAEVPGLLRSRRESGPSRVSSGRPWLVSAAGRSAIIWGDAQAPPGQGMQNPKQDQCKDRPGAHPPAGVPTPPPPRRSWESGLGIFKLGARPPSVSWLILHMCENPSWICYKTEALV